MIAFYYTKNPEANLMRQWDSGLLTDTILQLGYAIREVSTLKKHDRAIVAIPARHNAQHIDAINKDIQKIERCVLFLMGDEEADFPVEQINHPNIEIWVQNPHIGRHDNFHKLGTGYPHRMQQQAHDKKTDIFFSGQITHARRQQMQKYLPNLPYDVDYTATRGFTQGLEAKDYYRRMAQAKIAVAPSGAVVPDSFRAFEALESMCVLIADDVDPHNKFTNYWRWLFESEVPFLTISDWSNLEGYVIDIFDNYESILHEQTAWWLQWKRNFKLKIREQLWT